MQIGTAVVMSITISLFPYRGVESLPSRFRFAIQFILCLRCVPFSIAVLSRVSSGVVKKKTRGKSITRGHSHYC
jgi:hypothetical protein